MRILAIRGRNLASLAGEFEVDLQAEPLAAAGLFAICGPTGAGKSTLLDALCLALYDNTPRLRGADGRGIELPDVAKETTLPNDRRNILRRGCSEGYAEVDFVGNDAVAYRARWSVRRARNKADGKLQQAEMSLARLHDESPIGGHLKTEVLRAICERVGLSFEQFTRAVLLAQNEFFAFLKAGEDERAALLQTLTGTDRFERLSRRAFERNKLEQEKLRALREKLADQQPLSAEARAEREAERLTVKAETGALEARHASLAARLRWHEELARARTREEAARAALETARARHADAAERRACLARIDAVQPAQPLIAACERLASERGQLAAQLAEAGAAEEAARRAVAAGRARLDAAAAALADAELVRDGFAPAIARARELDTQIGTLAPERGRAASACEEAIRAVAGAREAAEANGAARRQCQDRLEQSEKWLAARSAIAPLADAWLRWDALLGTAGEADAQARAAAADVVRLQQDAQRHAQALDAARRAHSSHAAAVHERSAEADAAGAEVRAIDPAALAGQRAMLDARRDAVRAADENWRALGERRTQCESLRGETRTLHEALARGAERLAIVRSARPVAEAAAAESERAWRVLLEATGAAAEALRSQLADDVPCPVCGATEHPYAHRHPALEGALAQLAANRDEQRKAANDLAVEERTLVREGGSLAGRIAEMEARIGQAEASVRQLETDWDNAVTRLARSYEIPVPEAQAEIVEWLAACGEEIERAQQTVLTQEARHRAALARQQAAQQALDAARRQADAARELLARGELEAQRTAAALDATGKVQADAQQRLAAQLDELDAAHPLEPDWRARWSADPKAYHETCRQTAGAWLDRRAAAEAARTELARLVAEASGHANLLAQAEARREDAQRTLAQLDRELESRRCTRREVFAGLTVPGRDEDASPRLPDAPTVVDVENRLAGFVQAARTRLAEEERQFKRAEQQLAHDAATAAQLAKRGRELDLAAGQADAEFAAWLARFNASSAQPMTRETLQSLLARDPAWIGAERLALQQLENALATAAGAFEQTRALREAHEASGASAPATGEMAVADDPMVIEAALAELSTALADRRERLGGIELALRHDDAIRTRAAGLVADIEAQEAAARIWWQMNDLIGSADGKKFRNYAQQLTLDVLLGYANAHLKDLARRYRLERVPMSLALMVIDQDMGDEQRSVHSLSGGESFLVSLALALGLASLSSHRVRVESLFIDEGFGSLDADTLRIAMDALDRLQAMGRKVGVISHVEEMTERIPTRIRVRRLAGGQSRVEVIDGR